MRHARDEDLDRIDALLAEVRTLPHIKEKKRGVFYLKSKGFLHFHEDPAGMFAEPGPLGIGGRGGAALPCAFASSAVFCHVSRRFSHASFAAGYPVITLSHASATNSSAQLSWQRSRACRRNSAVEILPDS